MEFFKNINSILLSSDFNRIIYFCAVILLILLFKNIVADILIKIFSFNKKVTIRNNINYKIVSFMVTITLMYFSLNILNLSYNFKLIAYKIYRILLISSVAIGIKNIISPNLKIFRNLKENKKTNTMIDFVIKIIHVIIYLITILIIINELGYDVNAVIAGIGVGGIVIALGAQETFKNFFSSLSLLLDKTFFIGDWIEIDDISGIIEEISFRSVKVRTFDNALVNIPNNVIVNKNIINWSKMQKRKVKSNIVVSYNTTLYKLSKLVEDIKTMLAEDEEVVSDGIFVKFIMIDNYGYKIMIDYYTTSVKYKEFLAVKEKINFKIMTLIKKEKIELSYPTNTIYIENNKK